MVNILFKRLWNRLRQGDACLRIIAVNIAVWLLAALLGMLPALGITGFNPAEALAMPSSLHGLLLRPWSPLTYMFIHFSLLHLLVNVLWLALFASLLRQSRPGLLWMLYIGGGIAGAAAYLAAHALIPSLENIHGTLCGASAAVMAVIAYCAASQPMRRVRLMLFGSVPVIVIALVAVAFSLTGAGTDGAATRICHLGGVAFGAIAALPVPALVPSHRKEIRSGRRAARALSRMSTSRERLDSLLRRVDESGFHSLSAREQRELQFLSEKFSANQP